MSKKKYFCYRCHQTAQGARLVIGGNYVCPDCVYELEYIGETTRAVEPEQQYEQEHLFPLPPPTPKRRARAA